MLYTIYLFLFAVTLALLAGEMASGESPSAQLYWMSYNVAEGPRLKRDVKLQGCRFSVVVDSPLTEAFIGLRIIILLDDEDYFSPFLIVRDREARALTDRSVQIAPRTRLPSTHIGCTTSDSALSAIFKLERNADTSGYHLRPLEVDEIRQNPDIDYRVIYDRQFLGQPSPWASTFALNFSIRDAIPWSYGGGETIHYIYILPCERNNSKPVDLPPQIVQRIASHFFEPREFHGDVDVPWKKNILSFAMVCRSWLPAIETVFQILGAGGLGDDQVGDPVMLAYAIRLRPERGSHFRVFDTSYLEFWAEDLDSLALLEACKSFLEFSTLSLRSLVLHRSIATIHADILRRMQNVEVLEIKPDAELLAVAQPGKPNPTLYLSDIRHIIQGWRLLRQLMLTAWHKQPDPDAAETLPNNVTSALPLENLTVSSGTIYGRELLLFACATLQRVSLCRLTGLHNRDIATFLHIAAPSLNSLFINYCEVAVDDPDETFALEAVLPGMKKLDDVYINLDEGNFSATIISGKSGVKEQSPEHQQRLRISCRTFVLEGLPEALEVTGWYTIRILWSPEFSSFGEGEVMAKALDVAHERGIDLSFVEDPASEEQ